MNILIVHNYYQIPGGEDTVIANEKKLVEDYGNKVILYSRNNSELNQMSFFRKLWSKLELPESSAVTASGWRIWAAVYRGS